MGDVAMGDVVKRLAAGDTEIPLSDWRRTWDDVERGTVGRAEAIALLTALSRALPTGSTLHHLRTSLGERHAPETRRWPGTVNIVGTGGGPRTFNISTAAAFVAAAVGALVVKTGSRAHTGKVGSLDLLERLGIRQTKSHTETEDSLDRFGIAFAGTHVYPTVLTRLARVVLPTSMREFSSFLNAIGPFIARVPVTAQITGVSHAAPLDRVRELARSTQDRAIWLCSNDLGVDELLGFADNVVHTSGGDLSLPRGRHTSGQGSLASVAPADGISAEDTVNHFLDVLSGAADPVAVETVCLNAAAMSVASGHLGDWASAVVAAKQAVRTGVARDLVDLMREPRTTTAARGAAAHG